jgi:ATP-dependent Clp protease adaptor protein ClpS
MIPSCRAESEGGDGIGSGRDDAVLDRKPKLAKPPLYKVLLINDDFTPREFVVEILMQVFRMSRSHASQIMLLAHRRGLAVCGVYTREVAETKVTQVADLARKAGHPLQCTMEKE